MVMIEPSMKVSISYESCRGIWMSSPRCSTVMPRRRNASGIMPRLSYPVSLIVSSEPVMAAMPMKLPTSIISGRMVCSAPRKASTPSMVSRFEPTPDILAPMRLSRRDNCCR